MKKQPTTPSSRKNADIAPLLLPAVKGKMGNREYILCSMPAEEVAKRVMLAVNITGNNPEPSEKLQRDIKETRLDEIAEYLEEGDRFFNALVIAMCGDTAEWRGFSQLNGKGIDPEKHKGKMGFLSLSGEEKLYALDGQHRLRGLVKALEDGNEHVKDDSLSIIIVQHDDKRVQTGLKESRRLFTALNKHPKPTSKRDIIYLDEGDVAATVVRNLVEKEEHKGLFSLRERIHESPANQFHPGDVTSCYTTIGAFYDCVQMLLIAKHETTKKDLNKSKSSGDYIKKHCSMVTGVFTKIADNVPAMKSYFAIKNSSKMEEFIEKNNTKHVLFRPKGLICLMTVICAYHKKHRDTMSIEECAEKCCALSFDMNKAPLVDLVWDAKGKRVKYKGYPTLKGIYLHMLGLNTKAKSDEVLKKYREAIGNNSAKLPDKL